MDLKTIRKIINKERVSFIYLQFSDLLGNSKNVIVNAERLEDIAKDGSWFDGSSIEGFARISESDMLLKPDLSTFAIIPWSEGGRKTARFICDIYQSDGNRYNGDPRFILQKVLKEARALGFDYKVGAEFEFYLIDRSALPNVKPHDSKSYFDLAPQSRAATVCELTMKSLSAFGIKSEMHHHECGPGQHEIDTKYDSALASADNVYSLKFALRAYTIGTELKATWMPKPMYGFPGNGLHISQSLWKKNSNAFYNTNNRLSLSKTAQYFLAGQLVHAQALSAVVSPTINSYKRLVSGFEAPVYVCWGQNNRSSLIRIPQTASSQATRIEYRAPDPDTNPYLAFAVLLAAGLDGIKNKMLPPEPNNNNIYDFGIQELNESNIGLLPTHLGKAVEELEKDTVILDALGSISSRYIKIKKGEWAEFLTQVTPWELSRYL
jgi:glutamine synthetase